MLLKNSEKSPGKFGIVFGRFIQYNILIRKNIVGFRKEKR
jgi:hypothetical protein